MRTTAADSEAIQQVIPHRHEMLLVDRILVEDVSRKICVGIRDVPQQEFWARGHFPGNPVLPGVGACESAAQVSAYLANRLDAVNGIMGLGGLNGVKFRGPIRPGDQMIIMVQATKLRKGMLFVGHFQVFVEQELSVEGEIKGILLPEQAAT